MDRQLRNKIFCWLLYVTCFTLPMLVANWHGKVIATLGIAWAISVNWKTVVTRLRERPVFILLILYIGLYLIGLTYTENLRSAFKSLESLIPLVAFPLMIFTSDAMDDPKVVRNALIAFVVGVITLNLASLFFISRDLWDPVNLQSNLVLANEHIVKIHPAFLSLYISLSIFFLIDYFFPFKYTDRSKVGWLLFSIV